MACLHLGLSSVHNKIISATCGKYIRILDTETDIRITRISVAALIGTESFNRAQTKLIQAQARIHML